MAGQLVLPRVHVLVLCDDIEPSPMEDGVFNLRGVRTRLAAPSFPYQHPQLAVYLQMTGHEGTARGRIAVVNARTDEVVFDKGPHEVEFHGPLHFVPVSLWITDCTFPEEGIYYVQVLRRQTDRRTKPSPCS